jgi:hypothetical protein
MDWSWAAGWAVVLALSVLAVGRMVWRGRIGGTTQADLFPPRVRDWIYGESRHKRR